MSIEVLVYSPLMEEGNESITGWEKETIGYVVKHKSKVYAQIRGIAKGLRKHNLHSFDIDDIYSEVVEYLYKSDDYNLSKAIDRSSGSGIVSLEGYLNICIKFCVVRHCTEAYKEEKERIRDTFNDDDGKELSILDTVPDDRSRDNMDDIMYDFETLCRTCERYRYKYGPDIYLIMFIRLLTIDDDSLYKEMLGILGISRKDLSNIERASAEEEVMLTFARAIKLCGIERALNIIRPYVYSAEKIENTILAYK